MKTYKSFHEAMRAGVFDITVTPKENIRIDEPYICVDSECDEETISGGIIAEIELLRMQLDVISGMISQLCDKAGIATYDPDEKKVDWPR